MEFALNSACAVSSTLGAGVVRVATGIVNCTLEEHPVTIVLGRQLSAKTWPESDGGVGKWFALENISI
jgi:hypothetical protein